MTKINVGQAIQILANLGVIAGIVFLGIELQQNNALLGAEARASRAQVRIDTLDAAAGNPELLSAYLKLRAGQSLTPMEQLLTDIGTTRSLVVWQYVYGEFRAGLIDEADIPLENWRYVVSTRPELKVALENAGIVGLRPDFVQWMEENVVGR
jgi:hypothetical protein